MTLGSVLGGLGVAAGALGAHALTKVLDKAQLVTFEKGVHYQIFHALALLAVGLLIQRAPSLSAQVAAWAMLAGIVLFSGGLYAWLLTGQKWLVHVVPFGGTSFLIGWAALALAAWHAGRP